LTTLAKLHHDAETREEDPSLAAAATMDERRSNAAADERWRALIDEYGRYLRRVVARLCPKNLGLNFDDVEQEARVRLWKALRDQRQIDDPASYLYRIAATATIDAVRRVRARREEPLEDDSDATRPADVFVHPRSSLESATGRSLLLQRIERVIEGVPLDRRRLLRLHLEGFTTQEIAELNGWTEPKARNLLYRTLGDLREKLRARGIQYEGD
jgi:RNA polymerase sigma factor (sigma-70 family)